MNQHYLLTGRYSAAKYNAYLIFGFFSNALSLVVLSYYFPPYLFIYQPTFWYTLPIFIAMMLILGFQYITFMILIRKDTERAVQQRYQAAVSNGGLNSSSNTVI